MRVKTRIATLSQQVGNVSLSYIAWVILVLKFAIVSYFIYLVVNGYQQNQINFDSSFFFFIVVGFFAQIVDGALGMAYGVSCTSLLLTLGVPAKLASASVHTAEIFTTGVSGLSHIRFNNIDKRLFFRIVLTGTLGAVLGAYLLSGIFDGGVVKPYISIYLLVLGLYILSKAFKAREKKEPKTKYVSLLAFLGGLFDTVGGGGWGPIVTSNLLTQGHSPRYTIGTVNTAEFFVTYFATAVFIFVLGVQHLDIVLGLIIGGILAAPFGAYLASKINQKVLLVLVAVLVILTSIWAILNALWI